MRLSGLTEVLSKLCKVFFIELWPLLAVESHLYGTAYVLRHMFLPPELLIKCVQYTSNTFIMI